MAKKKTPQRKRKSTARRSLKPLLWGAGIAGLLILAGIVSAVYCLSSYSGEERWLYIPAEASEASVTDSLESALGETFGGRVSRLWKLQGGSPATNHCAYLACSYQVLKKVPSSLSSNKS